MMVNGGKKDKLSDKSKSVASKVVNAIVAKLEKASQALLGNIISALNEPKNKVKAKEQIKEQARVSIQAKLKEKQKQGRKALPLFGPVKVVAKNLFEYG